MKGTISAEVQNTNRALVDQISQQIKLNSSNNGNVNIPNATGVSASFPGEATPAITYWFCVNGIRYIYQYNVIAPYALTEDNLGTSCPSPSGTPPSSASGDESLLSSNMQLIQPLSGPNMVYQPSGSSVPQLWYITLDILYGSTGSYNPTTYACKNITLGGSFCDNSTITTAVDVRLAHDF